ncbi:MAG: hypothetical protein PHO62_07850 [Sulfurimonas sp.]|uniref:hypothetical protein n=1 Tax=Sulfurimonas sp. TaxID=2022749 RepID=UPI00262D3F24|nr:hypothetical protein [Sulfurimonas sp.]MDD5373320.1 hypothetical protein [Sulfurimonas sp.]
MKKIIFWLTVLMTTSVFAATGTEDMLASLGESGGAAGGAVGIGMVHAMFWIPILVFFTIAGGVVFFYIKQFKQKDDGLFKTILAGVFGVVLGILAYTATLKLIDGLFDSEGCGKEVVRAYLKDSINKGLNPSAQFGSNIRSVSCMSH